MDIMNGLLGFGDKLYQAFLVEDRWRLYLDGLGANVKKKRERISS